MLKPKIKKKHIFNVNVNTLSWIKTNNLDIKAFFPLNIKITTKLLFALNNCNFLIMGNGTNTVIKSNVKYIIKLTRSNYIYKIAKKIVIGSKTSNSNIANFFLKNSIYGLEFLNSIPGSIGGSLKMNAGCYNYDISKVLHRASSIDVDKMKILKICKKYLKYSYRNTMQKNYIFLECTTIHNKNKKKYINNHIKNNCRTRLFSQPIVIRTLGSTFQNAKNIKIWILIMLCGFKGINYGDIYISRTHCNFIANYHYGKNTSITFMLKLIKIRIRTKFQIEARIEINI